MKAKPNPRQNEVTPGLRRYLYLTAATTGAAVLIVEILGAKMLSPYLGTSHFVWTAQIAVTLLSLATGYFFGGWLVDRSPRLAHIYYCILGAALYLSFTVGLSEPVAYACLGLRLAAGSILASLFLFFVPLTLLAAVGPFLIRILTRSVNVVGSQVGRLSAVSTLGSVLGTILIGYVLIPFLPNSVTMYLTSGLLVAVSLGYLLLWGGKKAVLKAPAAVIAATLLAGFAGVRSDLNREFPGYRELTRLNSDFGMLHVLEEEETGHRVYLNDFLTQNAYDPESGQSVYLFTHMLHGLARSYTERIDRVLCIGMGVGIVPMQFSRAGAEVDVVEINPAVVPVAEEYFAFESGLVNLFIDDGRHYLNDCVERYDAVILDAFLGDSSPSHLMTREAFASIGRVLKPEGVLVINTFGSFLPGRDFFTASLDKTLQDGFESVRIHSSGSGNVFFVAANRRDLEFVRRPEPGEAHPAVRASVERAFRGRAQTNPRSGIVLTDDYNPVEFHDAANREENRRAMALRFRE